MQAPFIDPLSGIEQFPKALPLVDREAEMQMIRLLLNTVSHDMPYGPRALTMSGEVGVGKSRLLAEMYTEAGVQGFRVLEGRAYETGSMVPYLPFIEILRPLLHSSTETQLRNYVGLDEEMPSANMPQGISLTGMPLIAALTRLFPELPKLLRTTVEYEMLLPDQEKFRLLDAIATLIERVALEQPVLLSIDNLQWTDSASLELTVYLTVRLHTSRVALVGATRPPRSLNNWTADDPSIAMSASIAAAKTLSDLVRHGLLLFLPVGPMNEESATQHLRYVLPGNISRHITQTLLSRAEGNPFFLEELVRTLTINQHMILRDSTWRATRRIDTVVPENITLAVEQRLQGLSDACRELLRVASLFGRTFPLDALINVIHTTREGVQSLLDEATEAALIAKTSPTESIWDDDSESDVFPSVDYLSALETTHLLPTIYLFCQGIVQEVLSAEISQQRVQLLHGSIGAALEAHYGKSASAHAAELVRHYALGGEKKTTLRWCILAGEDAARQQAHREAISHFRLALRLLEVDTQVQEVYPIPSPAQIHLTIGESWFKLGQLDSAAQAFQQTLDILQQARAEETVWSASVLMAQANRQLSDVYRMQGNYEQARTHLQAASIALNTQANVMGMTDITAGMGVYEQATTIVARTQFAPWFAERASPGSTRVMNLQRISIRERILLLQAQATLDLMHYHPEEAEAALWESHQLATEIVDRSSQAFALHFVGWIRGWGEHIHQAIRLMKQANDLYIAAADPFRAALGDHALGIIYTALGEMEEAQRYTSRGLERAHRYGVQYNLGWLYWNQGILALFQGDWVNSEDHFQQAMQEATVNANARLKPVVLQAQAELQFRRGNWFEAEQLFQSSIQAAAATEWYPGTLALYGHFLAVTGRRAAAREQLDLATSLPEPPGFAGDFFIPFLAEGYIHLGSIEQAATYTERIRKLRGFMYYGNSVDRIFGVVAAQTNDWEVAEQSFADALALCRRAKNQPEEGAILYEQARSALMQSGTHTTGSQQAHHLLEHMHNLCNRAREIFTGYDMHRSIALVDTLQEGVKQLELRGTREPVPILHGEVQKQTTIAGYTLHFTFTRRELEVLRLVAEGHTDREVADALIISPRTVNRHLSNIFVKLDVPGRAAAVAYAIRSGVV
ncbi:MAG: AAA family ATPase [Ktedonobacteraceae bacterium]